MNLFSKKIGFIGRYLIDPNLLKTSTTLELLNRPVVFGNDMQDVASNSLPIAYGNFKRGYQIVDRLGMRVLRNPYIAHPIVRYVSTSLRVSNKLLIR